MRSWNQIDAPVEAKRKILSGEKPKLHWDGDCPVEKGDEIGLIFQRSEAGPVAQVWIIVTGVTTNKKGESVARYTVRDDRPLFLASGLGYTRSAARAIDTEASVDDPEAQAAHAAQARLANAAKRVDPRKRERRIRDRVRAVLGGLNGEEELNLLANMERVLIEAEETSSKSPLKESTSAR